MKWYAFIKTKDGEEISMECILNFESVESNFTSLGTLRSAWSNTLSLRPTKAAQTKSRLRKQRRDHKAPIEPLRKSLRLRDKRESTIPVQEIPESPDPIQDETFNGSGEEAQEARSDISNFRRKRVKSNTTRRAPHALICG